MYFLFLHQMTPLHLAAERGRLVVLKHLVDQGPNVNIQDQNGVKFMHLCDCRKLHNTAYLSLCDCRKLHNTAYLSLR